MYLPQHFALTDPAALERLIAEAPLAWVSWVEAGRIAGTPVPLLAELGQGRLVGHVARSSPLVAALDGRELVAWFTGPDAYVSPRFYVAEGHVPTWNYVAAEVRGVGKPLDEAGSWAALERLSEHFERGPRPWRPAELPAGRGEALARGIVGFELAIGSWELKGKLSQNRAPADWEGAHAALATSPAEGDRAVARWMLASRHGGR